MLKGVFLYLQNDKLMTALKELGLIKPTAKKRGRKEKPRQRLAKDFLDDNKKRDKDKANYQHAFGL